MVSIQPSPLLKFALAVDAAISLAVAVLQVLAAEELSRLLLLPRMLLLESGIFLVGYALLLAVLARSRSIPRALLLFLVIGNAGWAAGCGLVGAFTGPSLLGAAFLAIQALTVLLFAGLQMAGLKRSARQPARMAAQSA